MLPVGTRPTTSAGSSRAPTARASATFATSAPGRTPPLAQAFRLTRLDTFGRRDNASRVPLSLYAAAFIAGAPTPADVKF